MTSPGSAPGSALVLGAGGLAGSALVRRLVDEGWTVTATVRAAAAARRVADALGGARVATFDDPLDRAAILRLLERARPEIVFSMR